MALALKAVFELVIALVVGSAVGFGVAYGLVVWLGPSALVEPAALGWAAVGALRGASGIGPHDRSGGRTAGPTTLGPMAPTGAAGRSPLGGAPGAGGLGVVPAAG